MRVRSRNRVVLKMTTVTCKKCGHTYFSRGGNRKSHESNSCGHCTNKLDDDAINHIEEAVKEYLDA